MKEAGLVELETEYKNIYGIMTYSRQNLNIASKLAFRKMIR